jgi:hypothetical protein
MKQQHDDENINNELVDLNKDDDASDFEIARVWIAKAGGNNNKRLSTSSHT